MPHRPLRGAHMIVVFKFANFTCCGGRCCDSMNGFGHASLFCTNLGFGLSVGHSNPHFATWGDFIKYQLKKFGRVDQYVCIPTTEDEARLGGVGEEVKLVRKIPMSEAALSSWWDNIKRKEGGRDCADLVTDALKQAGAKDTSCWARRPGSLFMVTPNSCIAYGEALALDMCNSGRIGEDEYDALLSHVGAVQGVNKFKGPGGGCWPF